MLLAGQSRRRFKTILGVAAAVGLATLIVVGALDLRTQRAQLLRAGDRRAANLAMALTGYLRQTFVAVDASLRQLAAHSERIGGADAKDGDWRPALVAALAALPAVGSISVTDKAGIVRHTTQPVILGQTRRDQYIFRRLATDTLDELVADPPFRALAGVHPYLIPLGRRLRSSNGGFGGVIVATVIPDELRDVFRSADIGEHGVVTVFHRDGFVVFREPSREDPIGEVASRQPLFEAARVTPATEVYRGPATPNGSMLRTAFRSLPDRDLIVAVSLGEDELLAEWRRDAASSGVIGVVLVLALATILFLLFREMDTRLAAEEALGRSQRLESIGRLTGGIAHDFNNLLTVILGNVALIQDGLGSDSHATTAESAAQIERAATRGSALIRQLLAFARRRPLQSRTVDLVALIEESKPMLDRVLGEDVTLALRGPPGRSFWATVDPTGMESALLNLCINARDAMPNGGTISIDLTNVRIDAQEAQEHADVGPGRYVVVRVQDNGAGIPAEHIPHLFEPFFTTKDVGRGTGLGLSTVYGFVKQSSGHVKVASTVGSGTVVTLYFPEASAPAAAEAVRETEDGRHGSGEVILLVEDEPDLLALGARFLEDLGYRVIPASNGPAALEAARDEPRVDLLLSDVVMSGGMSGLQLAKDLRIVRPAIPVLFMSGYSDDIVDAAGDDVDAPVITKPYDRRRLATAVRTAIRSTTLVAFVVALLARGMAAQGSGSIRGVVRDSTQRPMSNADVFITPGNRRVRTDSTGRFAFDSLGAGQYIVRARRVGYGPTEWSIDLSKSGHADVQLLLGGRIVMLDTVYSTDGRPCEPKKYEGFLCRRATAAGTFMDYTDIDTMQVDYSADLLRDVGGFTTDLRPSRNGVTRVAGSRACTIVLLNGYPASWSSIPDVPSMIVAIEIYKSPKDIPKEFNRFTWGKERCWLVAWWTYDAAYRSFTIPRRPH